MAVKNAMLAATLLSLATVASGSTGNVYVPARPIQAPAPAIPENGSGWVHVSFVVGTEGSVKDVIVLDSGGGAAIEDAVVEAIEKWTFEPATLDGKPVQQRLDDRLVVVKWSEDSRTVRKELKRTFEDARRLIKAGKFETAEIELIKARDELPLSYETWTTLHLLLSDVYGGLGERPRQLENLLVALPYAAQVLSFLEFDNLVRAVFGLQVELKMYRSALATYRDLTALEAPYVQLLDLFEKGNLEQVAQEVTAVVNGAQAFTVNGEIGKRGSGLGTSFWNFEVLRRRIAFSEINGALERFELRCASHVFSDKVDMDREWTLPESWGGCGLFVFGQPGSTFKLLQLPPPVS